MPRLAKQIVVKREGNEVELLVDGEPFPWYTGAGIDLHVDRADSPGVTLTLLADEVQVEDRQRKPPPPDVDWLLIDAESDIKVGRYSTNQRFIEGDIITRSDGALSKIEKIDVATKCWHVSPYETAASS
jgi:hypothetical protein